MSEPIHIISLGAGVQSSTMALMAAKGEITPMPECAIFADTQAEPKSVYTWLDWLEKKLPFPVHRVTAGNLTTDSLRVRRIVKPGSQLPIGTKYIKKLIPVFGKNNKGEKTAALGRRCTFDYKIRPLIKLAREIANIKRGQKTVGVVQWIGISIDEAMRQKDPREPWISHRWPLIENSISRKGCLDWMQRNGFPEPPRSACFYCPFHSDDEWQRIKVYDPESWGKAIAFDHSLREQFKEHDKSLNMEVFLHDSLLPLGQVDFSAHKRELHERLGMQLDLFNNECEGLCGV